MLFYKQLMFILKIMPSFTTLIHVVTKILLQYINMALAGTDLEIWGPRVQMLTGTPLH